MPQMKLSEKTLIFKEKENAIPIYEKNFILNQSVAMNCARALGDDLSGV